MVWNVTKCDVGPYGNISVPQGHAVKHTHKWKGIDIKFCNNETC